MRYYREYKDLPGKITEVTRDTLVFNMEEHEYYPAGTVKQMEDEAKQKLHSTRETPFAFYSIKADGIILTPMKKEAKYP
jgi:hypothetical protein